jgi:hypothetical protein
MAQDFRVGTSGFFQGVGEDAHLVKGAVDVDCLRESFHLGGEPRGVDGDGAERIAEDVTEEVSVVFHESIVIPLHFNRLLLAAIGLLYALSPQRLNRGKMQGKTLDGHFAPVDTTFRTSFQVGPNVGCME